MLEFKVREIGSISRRSSSSKIKIRSERIPQLVQGYEDWRNPETSTTTKVFKAEKGISIVILEVVLFILLLVFTVVIIIR